MMAFDVEHPPPPQQPEYWDSWTAAVCWGKLQSAAFERKGSSKPAYTRPLFFVFFLCSPGCPGTYVINQAGPRDPSASARLKTRLFFGGGTDGRTESHVAKLV